MGNHRHYCYLLVSNGHAKQLEVLIVKISEISFSKKKIHWQKIAMQNSGKKSSSFIRKTQRSFTVVCSIWNVRILTEHRISSSLGYIFNLISGQTNATIRHNSPIFLTWNTPYENALTMKNPFGWLQFHSLVLTPQGTLCNCCENCTCLKLLQSPDHARISNTKLAWEQLSRM